MPAARWRDRAILSAMALSLRAEHPGIGPLDTHRLEAALAEARALISRGVSDPYLLAAAYASGIVRARPLRPGSAALALAAAFVALRPKGLRLAAAELETAARAGINAVNPMIDAGLSGVEFIPCQMTLEMFGLTRDDLIDGMAEPVGAATVIGLMQDGSAPLFI